MAQTYTVNAIAVTFANGKHMLSLFNGAGSGRILRIKRVWQLNNQVAAVTGVLTTMELKRTSAQSGGTAVAPLKNDTASEAIPAQVLCAFGASPTATDRFRQWMWSNDEPSVSSGTSDEFETMPSMMCVWDSATGDPDIEPIVCREGQGVTIHHTGTSAVGLSDFCIEFTMAAT